jgi:very-short-patch-repair endonuclease
MNVKKKLTKSESRVKFLTELGYKNAKDLRSRATKHEVKVKKFLQELGYLFKFQCPIICNKKHLYILDFYLLDYGLFLEIDGYFHSLPQNVKRDNLRSRRLKREGLLPIRLTNKQVEVFTKEQINQIITSKINLLKSLNNA